MSRPRIVIVGAGFAGYHAARTLSRLARGAAGLTLINPTDYFLYLPLLPEVAGGILDPRTVAVSLTATLPDVRLVLGQAVHTDLEPQHRLHRAASLPMTTPNVIDVMVSPTPRTRRQNRPRSRPTRHRWSSWETWSAAQSSSRRFGGWMDG